MAFRSRWWSSARKWNCKQFGKSANRNLTFKHAAHDKLTLHIVINIEINAARCKYNANVSATRCRCNATVCGIFSPFIVNKNWTLVNVFTISYLTEYRPFFRNCSSRWPLLPMFSSAGSSLANDDDVAARCRRLTQTRVKLVFGWLVTSHVTVTWPPACCVSDESSMSMEYCAADVATENNSIKDGAISTVVVSDAENRSLWATLWCSVCKLR